MSAALRLLPGWSGLSLDELLLRARALVEDATFPSVRAWRDAGGQVFGHFQVYAPEELAHAAGMLPVKVRGAAVEPRQAEARFGSYLCSILKTSLELALSGRLELDLFVVPPICDAARNLAAIWGRAVTHPSRLLYLPQHAESAHAVGYLDAEYLSLRAEIERVAGRPVTADALRRSIVVFNTNRRLLRELYAIRRERPWLLAVDEAYVLTAMGGLVPREEHNEILRAALPSIESRGTRPQDRIRVVYDGGFCEQPPLDLLRVLGQSCYVVDDDLLIGLRWITEDVPIAGDPVLNLARAYFEHSAHSPVQHDDTKTKEQMLLRRIAGSGARAAIISAAKMCEPGLDEQVAYAAALETAQIPYFIAEFEERMTGFEQLEIQIETFVENVLFA